MHKAERLTILDIWAAHSLLIVQFIDDSFVLQSTLAGLRAADLALDRFAAKWIHKFKGGRKGASVLAVGVMPPHQSALGSLQGVPVQLVNQLSVLGPAIDVNLSLQPHLDSTCARVLAMTSELGASLSSVGLGVPLQVAQFNSRVEPAVLHGAEILASCNLGFSFVASRLNAAQYRAFKALIAVGNDLGLGDGGQARLFAELGVPVRLGARLALRIMATRARILALPPGNTIEPTVLVSARVTGATWLEHAASIMYEFGAEPDFLVFCSRRALALTTPEARRSAVKQWKRVVLHQAVAKAELHWFQEHLARIPCRPVGRLSFEISMFHDSFHLQLRWAPWSRSIWKAHRAWLLCRLTGCFPLSLWGFNGNQQTLSTCPGCLLAGADLEHWLLDCPATDTCRALWLGLDFRACFRQDQDLAAWHRKLCFRGLPGRSCQPTTPSETVKMGLVLVNVQLQTNIA